MNHVESPEISVVICALNAQRTLGLQLDAVLAQACSRSFEVVLVDNGSEDSTHEIAASYALDDPRLRVITEYVRGVNRARNTGIRHSKGELIVLCDSDDVVEQGWLGSIVEAHEAGTYVGGALRRGAPNTVTVRRRWAVATQRADVPSLPFRGWPTPVGANCCFERTLWTQLQGFDESMGIGGDETEFFARAGHFGYQYVKAPHAIVGYRLPATPRAVWGRGWNYGRNTQVLRTRVGEAIDPTLMLKHWGVVISSLPKVIVERRGSYAWLHTLAKRSGEMASLVLIRMRRADQAGHSGREA